MIKILTKSGVQKIVAWIKDTFAAKADINPLLLTIKDSSFIAAEGEFVIDNDIWEDKFDFSNPPMIVKVVTEFTDGEPQTAYFTHQESRALEGWFETYKLNTTFDGSFQLCFVKQSMTDDSNKMAFIERIM